MGSLLFRPPTEDESSPSTTSSLVSDHDTTINLAHIERLNSMSKISAKSMLTEGFDLLLGQQIDDDVLVQMMVNDEIYLIFYTIARETPAGWTTQSSALLSTQHLRRVKPEFLRKSFRCSENKTVEFVSSELELIDHFARIVEQHDPDILVCYDMKLSLYYLLRRAKQKYNIDLLVRFSRIPEQHDQTTRARSHMSADGNDLPVVVGRILLDLWKILRSEITLNIYTFENTVYHVLHERVPHYDFDVLSKWFIDEGANPSFGSRN